MEVLNMNERKNFDTKTILDTLEKQGRTRKFRNLHSGNKHFGIELISWTQRRCRICKRFLSKWQKEYCRRCGEKIKKKLHAIYEITKYRSNKNYREKVSKRMKEYYGNKKKLS
jgi:uncharacterized paraquat-inducible protein A